MYQNVYTSRLTAPFVLFYIIFTFEDSIIKTTSDMLVITNFIGKTCELVYLFVLHLPIDQPKFFLKRPSSILFTSSATSTMLEYSL